jgi:predicted amidophosphoribosyltransferase
MRSIYAGYMSFHDPGRCPSCGERVTPYAAGCALCGAELDPRRWHNPPSRLHRFLGRHPLRVGGRSVPSRPQR